MELSSEEIQSLKKQRFLSACFSPFLYFIILAGHYYFRCSFQNRLEFRKSVWEKLKNHQGPVIWVANHCTLVDTWLIYFAIYHWKILFQWYRIWKGGIFPWSTPEYTIYYPKDHTLRSRLLRAMMYLGRGIPIIRQGEEPHLVQWREKVFEKCVWALKNRGSVFVFPEAGLSPNGWLNKHRPKDFIGKLALRVPETAFLCLYLRGESQATSTVFPIPKERFRMYADFIHPNYHEDTPLRIISQSVFDTLARLQNIWFEHSVMPKNCGGNDIIDLKSPHLKEHCVLNNGSIQFDSDWIHQHLTLLEQDFFKKNAGASDQFITFWKSFAAKEAAFKALAQAGIEIPSGSYTMLEVNFFRKKVTHLPTGVQVDIDFTAMDEDKIHCIAVFRGGYIGDESTPSDVLWDIKEVPPGANISQYAKEKLLDFIAESIEDINSAQELDITFQNGIPKVLRGGKICDWGISLSHSGRFAAYSFMIS